MQLINKYLTGASILIIIWVFFVGKGTILNPLPFFIIGVVTTIVGVTFAILLFSPERIKGLTMEFEAAPDLSTFRIISTDPSKGKNIKKEIPEVAFCGACGQEIYNPFLCNSCGQLLCGKHYLPGDHECREGK